MPDPNITSADLEAVGLKVFDPAEYITSDEAAVAYINEALAEMTQRFWHRRSATLRAHAA